MEATQSSRGRAWAAGRGRGSRGEKVVVGGGQREEETPVTWQECKGWAMVNEMTHYLFILQVVLLDMWGMVVKKRKKKKEDSHTSIQFKHTMRSTWHTHRWLAPTSTSWVKTCKYGADYSERVEHVLFVKMILSLVRVSEEFMTHTHIHTTGWRCFTAGLWSGGSCWSLSCLWPHPLPCVCVQWG